ncbi:MAG: hypothetical protein HZA62_05680 [Rhodocyclales bacterium]|nr:hypothetical protein [Rhodocyclales bacterium]
MAYELAWEPRGVALIYSGLVSFDDIRNATIGYQGDSRFDDLHYVIADFLRVTGCNAKPTEIDYVWALDLAAGISNPKIKKAIITTHPGIIALAAHYKAQEIRAFPTEVFTQVDDARRWLDAGPPG